MFLILYKAFFPNQLFIFVRKEDNFASSVDLTGIFFPWLLNTYFPNSIFPWAFVQLDN